MVATALTITRDTLLPISTTGKKLDSIQHFQNHWMDSIKMAFRITSSW